MRITNLSTTNCKKYCPRTRGILELGHVVLTEWYDGYPKYFSSEHIVLSNVFIFYLNWQWKKWGLSRFNHRHFMFTYSFPYGSRVCMSLQVLVWIISIKWKKRYQIGKNKLVGIITKLQTELWTNWKNILKILLFLRNSKPNLRQFCKNHTLWIWLILSLKKKKQKQPYYDEITVFFSVFNKIHQI